MRALLSEICIPFADKNKFLSSHSIWFMKKLIIFLVLILSPVSLFAEVSMGSDTDSMVTQLKAIIDQYGTRIKALETENNILRNEMMKAGIKIPLSAYSGAVISVITPTTSTSSGGTTVSSSWTVASITWSTISNDALSQITTQYSLRYAEFIKKIHADWSGIRWAYKMPATASIGGYEFVKKGTDNNVFVDIIYSGATASGVYDAKILYEYHTGTYQRKLVGFFEFNKASGYYITRTGKNTFAWVARTFIADPLVTGTVTVPVTATSTTASWQITSTSTAAVPTISDIEKAYGDKRYLTTISLSNAYLQANSATLDILRIRYRTFFIIGKYSESLTEIAKIEALGKLDKAVACDAQVIATYSKSQTLVDQYTKVCKGS